MFSFTARAVAGAALATAVSVGSAFAEELEEVLVLGQRDARIYELAETLNVTPDSASLLKKAVGANVVSNGPLTGMAQYRGMSRFRISTRVNGVVISPVGPNWMDPPLSYAPAAHLESLEVVRGIAPVSAGQETIGGVVNANTWRGDFSPDGPNVAARVRAGGQSVNGASLLSGTLALANEQHLVKLAAMREAANDAEFPGGDILPTEYQRERYDIGYRFRAGPHSIHVDYGRLETGDAGTPALPMDIDFIDADLIGLGYDFDGEAIRLAAKAYYNNNTHGMTNFHLRLPPPDGMRRRNIASGESGGFSVQAQMGGWKFGIDGHDELHSSDIDNPTAGFEMFFVDNFNDAERRVVGVFAERSQPLGERWLADVGVRYNRVSMDAGSVDATPARMGMPPAVALRDAFNEADKSSRDNNVDWVVKLSYLAGSRLSYYGGVSRKNRSPAYQERFLWLPLQATAGLADGRTYTGNLALKAEVAHEAELGLDWHREALRISPRLFYRDVSDYIQGTPSADASAVAFVRMMNVMNGIAAADPLQFTNVDATFYGADVDWAYQIGERWSVDGIVNYVRGKRDDVNDNLYRIAPLNAFVGLNYDAARWGMSVETFLYDDQTKVSATNAESPSDGYALFHLKGYWQIVTSSRLSFGVENIFDVTYRDHLNGVNRVRGNPAIAPGERLPGYGRSFFARFDFNW